MMRFKSVKYISTIDIRSGYWQVPLDEKSREACSFLFNGRNYLFKRMPFGVSEFQKYMEFVLRPAISNFVTIYVDDIIIHNYVREPGHSLRTPVECYDYVF